MRRSRFQAFSLGLLAAAALLMAAPGARAEISLDIGSQDALMDLPLDYEGEAADYVVERLGFQRSDIIDIRLLAIRTNPFNDVITRIQAIVKFRDRPGSVVVVMHRYGKAITHFTQGGLELPQ